MGKCMVCGEELATRTDKITRMCKPCRKNQVGKVKSAGSKFSMGMGGGSAAGAKVGGSGFGGAAIGGGGADKCSHCGRMLSSMMEKNSRMCDACRKKPGGFRDFAGGFKSCSKCGKSLFSHSEKQKGICDHCQTFKKGF